MIIDDLAIRGEENMRKGREKWRWAGKMEKI